MKQCAVCEQTILTPEQAVAEGLDHHLQRSPVDLELCLGCWIAFVEVELFVIRAGVHRTLFGRQTYAVMRQLLQFVRDAKL
jgi:hypothetical protein